MLGTLFTLFFLHFLCDYPLQGPFLSQAKNPRHGVPDYPWYQAMAAHAFIHAGAVALILDWKFGLAEFVVHFAIDVMKCHGAFGEKSHRSVNLDQGLHLLAKVLWWGLA